MLDSCLNVKRGLKFQALFVSHLNFHQFAYELIGRDYITKQMSARFTVFKTENAARRLKQLSPRCKACKWNIIQATTNTHTRLILSEAIRLFNTCDELLVLLLLLLLLLLWRPFKLYYSIRLTMFCLSSCVLFLYIFNSANHKNTHWNLFTALNERIHDNISTKQKYNIWTTKVISDRA